ncbi:BREX system Lon protease-like protein BrxL [Paracoccaceae bacterium]|nr:BREX system Lon protease-like protein BrxL [Paracoccaceae bacterium]
MTALDDKINQHFPGLVVRKDLVKTVKGNAIVPSYVLEYLLGQYCATNDETSIESGIDTVKDILAKHYVHRNEANLTRSNIRERGRYKVIDKVQVSLNDRNDTYEASFANLGIKKVLVDTDTIKNHPKLLVTGVWCISDIEYEHTEDSRVEPWILASIKPIQLSQFDFEGYLSARKEFSTDEWIDLLMQSIGFNPEMFGKRTKMMQLLRLVPFVERNFNLIELGPKGTGKSHIFSEFSPHGMLISGGEVTVPKLFVNNSSGKLGLVGYWDVVAFDEFAGKQKKVDKALVDILKNYLANKTFSRGVETLGADASMAFIGNTKHNVPFMLKYSDLFEELPEKYYDPAFLDRLHAFLPGWEVDIIRGEMFSDGYGFVVDYIAEILRHLRNQDFSDRYQANFDISSDIATRDRDAVNKTFSGLMKILFPNGEQTIEETEEILQFSMECRKRVKDQLMRLDSTFERVDFSYTSTAGTKTSVKTLEEIEYPNYYYKRGASDDLEEDASEGLKETEHTTSKDTVKTSETNSQSPTTGHITISENQRGISFDKLFGPHLSDAKKITLTDPYIRVFHQIRNLIEFVETIVKVKQKEDDVDLHLITQPDDMRGDQQQNYLTQVQQSAESHGVNFTWEFDNHGTTHARHIITDNGWKISLDRGLDIFQRFEMNDAFNLNNRLQETRTCKSFEITYLKV